ncbi:MAG: hypothetical protein SGILL_004634, partial [Bacillariaceae sp.]
MVHHQKIRSNAIASNNRGVQLLKAGDLTGAIFALAQGLDSMKCIMEDPGFAESSDSADGMDTEEEPSLSFMETCCDSSVSPCHPQADEPSYVFCSPIELKTATAIPSLKISLFIIFNLALSHHLNGIRQSDREQLEKALRLYECVYRISHEEDVDLSVLHAMALTNNLGHVHLILKDTHKSQKCFEQLLATLIYFVEVSDGNTKEIESLKGFFSNATNLSMKKHSAAAA